MTMMTQQSIDRYLDQRLARTEQEIRSKYDVLFASTLTTFQQLEQEPYYRRQWGLQSHMEVINNHFRDMQRTLEQAIVRQYTESYLRNGYIYERTLGQDVGYAAPIASVILASSIAAIPLASFSALLEGYRNTLMLQIRSIFYATGLSAELILKPLEKAFQQSANRMVFALEEETLKARNRAVDEAGAKVLDKLSDAQGDDSDGTTVKKWISQRDDRVRNQHRILDNRNADDGWFYYGQYRARHPKGFGVMELDANCRCKIVWVIQSKDPQAPASDFYYWNNKIKGRFKMDFVLNSRGDIG